ncbi:MAG: putative transcriptional regulatory protein (MerR family) [Geminicoccaceae bacterium]|jgi:DNA-binding transcriptional MerR regulator|nr:putative transcriptional regulatory protein (MerR family) [Geminicoccaceae bacterium]
MVASAEGGTNGTARQRAGARPAKSASAFRTISEVAGELDVAQHVLRFWESKFPQVRPLKRGGGRRYYRPEDVDLLRQIRSLLYEEGYTIKGAQKLLKGHKRPGAEEVDDNGSDDDLALPAHVDAAPAAAIAPPAGGLAPEVRQRLRQLREELVALRTALRAATD